MKRDYIYLPACVSTNDELKSLVRGSASPVTAVLRAGTQTGGRGRQNKAFYSPEGGVWFSAAYPLTGKETNVPFLTLLAGLAVCRALESACPAPYRVKWPNDVYLNGKKLCGILTELCASGGSLTAVVGIGINTAVPAAAIPETLRGVMTSLQAEGLPCPGADAITRTVAAMLDHYVYDCRALYGGTAEFAALLNARSYLTGKTVTVENASGVLTGRVEGISPAGLLVLDTAEGKREVRSGTVNLEC